ncbi:TetR/AcrR family transcriptional regulator [Streptomyces boncukensis]|uniref:TetR/AcrR family transcriptional regulator n=1 Tax=Streptomyces boncukensis TaxID=2711219 RepID=A0A6G4WUL7_9ACTN|nr:TetR/AcrR family transcriptional regulator [Streptomyces boncukensis]NGO68693.1 TetR/AcrR family transcriptional regulator [Streptomyces boncukensis]
MAVGKDNAPRERARSVELLWGDKERRGRGPKPVLSIERIVETAIEVADAEGLAAVSMQRIASEFGFTTMSLYRYLPGKAQLVDLMTDGALGTPPALEEISGDWRAKLEVWARQLWHTYHRHPWLFELPVARPGTMGPNELSWLESAIRAFADTRLSGAEQLDAVFTLSGLIRSWTYRPSDLEDERKPLTTDVAEQWGSAVGELIEEHKDSYPALLAAMNTGGFDPEVGDGEEFGLRCVLDGIGVVVDQRSAESTGS